MHRRKFVALAGASAAGATAGCQTVERYARSGPPSFENVEMTGPDRVGVGAEFGVTVAATNAGGRPGDFTATLSVGDPPFTLDRSVEIADVGVGRTESTEVGPLELSSAGELTFRITDHDASHDVSVVTRELSVGETLDADPTTLTVGEPRFESGLFASADDRRLLVTPDGDGLFAVLPVEVRNAGEQGDAVRLDPTAVEVSPGEVVESIQSIYVGVRDLTGPSGPYVGGLDVFPGDAVSGWLLARVPYDGFDGALTVSWNGGLDDPPEATWRATDLAIPRFEVERDAVPDSVEIGTEASLSIAVANAGSAAGTFRGVVERRRPDEDEWTQQSTASFDLAPGERRTWTTTLAPQHVETWEYAVRPGGFRAEVAFTAVRRRFGESYTTPDGLAVTPRLGGPDFDGFADSYTVEDAFGNETVEADPGRQFAFVSVVARNDGSEPLYAPDEFAFALHAGDAAAEPLSPDGRLASPVSGPAYPAGRGALEPGDRMPGWLVFDVPASVAPADVTLRFDGEDASGRDVAAEWTA